jgi:hypothetical protein
MCASAQPRRAGAAHAPRSASRPLCGVVRGPLNGDPNLRKAPLCACADARRRRRHLLLHAEHLRHRDPAHAGRGGVQQLPVRGGKPRRKPHAARSMHARLRCARRAAAATALMRSRHPRSFLGQAWKGDKENPQSNGAATRTILACAAVYACFLGLSSACPRPASQAGPLPMQAAGLQHLRRLCAHSDPALPSPASIAQCCASWATPRSARSSPRQAAAALRERAPRGVGCACAAAGAAATLSCYGKQTLPPALPPAASNSTPAHPQRCAAASKTRPMCRPIITHRTHFR